MKPVLLAKNLTLDIAVGEFPALLMASQYSANGALALMFISDDDINEPLCKASLNIDPISSTLPFNQFVCKSYSENEGMEEYLIDAGLAIPTGKTAICGFTMGSILELSPELSAILKESLHVQAH